MARRGLQRTTRTGFALGAPVTMTVLHERGDLAESAVDEAFAEMHRVDDLMSLYRVTSQLSRLNQEGSLHDPHPDLVRVLRQAIGLSRQTAGAFDVTVQPLWSLYSKADARETTPGDEELKRELAKVGWRRIEVSPREVRLRDGTQITLNGIAQGFAADRALDALRRRGIVHALVDTGEIGAMGGKDAESPWTIGIQHPRRADQFLKLAKLRDRCLSTSGDYATTFRLDHSEHHIFDPRTGHSPSEFCSVSVAAPTAMEADGLSTALFVLGLERGMKWIRSRPQIDALFVLKDGSSIATENFPA